jgi:hypothetical protein
VPEFWSSDELWETLETGEVLSIDYEFFSSLLYRRLREDCQHSSGSSADAVTRDGGRGGGSGGRGGERGRGEEGGGGPSGHAFRGAGFEGGGGGSAPGGTTDVSVGAVHRLTTAYLRDEDFTLLCQKVLPFLGEDDLCEFTRGLLPAGAEVLPASGGGGGDDGNGERGRISSSERKRGRDNDGNDGAGSGRSGGGAGGCRRDHGRDALSRYRPRDDATSAAAVAAAADAADSRRTDAPSRARPADARAAAAAAPFAGVAWRSEPEAVLASAVATRGRAVVRLVEEGEAEGEVWPES